MEITVKGLGDDGFGYAYTDKGKKVKVPYTLPGEKVESGLILKRRGSKVMIEKIIEKSEDRIEPECKYFGKCGGCRLQHLSYEKQLEWKKERLKQIFGESVDIVPSPKIFNYRNRMDFVVTVNGTGLRKVGSFWDVVDIDDCKIHDMNNLLLKWNKIQEKFSRYDIKKQEGIIRYIVLRKSVNTDDSIISFQLNKDGYESVLDELKDFSDGNLVYTLIDSVGDLSVTDDVHVLKGNPFYMEDILGFKFKIPITSFFQTNIFQFTQLVKDVKESVSGSKLVDLFGGVGTIGIILSDKFDEVESLELVEDSVRLANENAKLNNLDNFESKVVDANKLDEISCDVLIVDPPRPGLLKSVGAILKSLPEKIVYISCNPESQKEDLDKLKLKYNIVLKKAYDMFPHTQHMECVAWLERKSE